MAANHGPHGPTVGGWGNAQQQARRPQWRRTPRWLFWRPAWRVDTTFINGIAGWQYQTHKQRARAVLEQQFNSGGGNETPRAEGQHANYFLNGRRIS